MNQRRGCVEDECSDCGSYCGECLASGTKITMADGSVKNIEDILEGDMVLSFDHETGRFMGSPVLYAYKGEEAKCAFTLSFSNGATLSIVGEHDLFEKESLKYVTITEENAEEFIGKHFYSAEEKTYVELLSVTFETKPVSYYELYTEKTLNMVANGMLNVADDVDHLLNIYEFNEDLSINLQALSRDLQKYGLFGYTEMLGFTPEEFEAWNSKYIGIAMGKGLVSPEDLWNQNREYLDQRTEIIKCA